MTLNKIWISFFVIALITASCKLLFWDDQVVFKNLVVEGLFGSAKTAFEISLFMTGALCMCLGFMRIGEKGGAIAKLSKLVSPLFNKIFPEIPKNHPAIGAIMMNFSANMLGLDNAATPLGLKAMKELQDINPNKETASNAQIMFLVLNTAGMTIIPISVITLLAASKDCINPTSIFLPVLITTYFSALSGLILVALKQRINLFQPVILGFILISLSLVVGLMYLIYCQPNLAEPIANVLGNIIIFGIFFSFIALAVIKKVDVYAEFVEGAKEGFSVALNVIPYLVAMLVAIGVFRQSGALDGLTDVLKTGFLYIGLVHTEFVNALPIGIMKPFSGGGARGLLVDVIKNEGVNSFVTKVAATMQGGTETTFYVLAVYFGSVNIKNTRYSAGYGLIVDIIGVVIAILVSYLFYPLK